METSIAQIQETNDMQDAAIRTFKREHGQLLKKYCRAGAIIEQTAFQTADADDSVLEVVKQAVYTTSELAEYICTSGARNIHEMTLWRATKAAEASVDAEKLMQNGTIILEDMKQPGMVKNKLHTAGIKETTVKNIVRNQEQIRDVLQTKQVLYDFAAASGKLDRSTVEFINSRDIFQHELFSGDFQKAVGLYFWESKNEVLKKVNPVGMTPREIKKLLNNAEKYGLTTQDSSVLKVLHQNKTAAHTKRITRYAYGVRGRIRDVVHLFGSVARRMDEDAVVAGVHQMYSMYHGARAAAATLQFATKTTWRSVQKVGTVALHNPASRAVSKALKQNVQQVKVAASKNPRVIKVKEMAEQVRQKTARIRNKTATINRNRKRTYRKIKSAQNKAMRVVKTPLRILTFPVTALNQFVFRLKEMLKNKLILPIAGILFTFLMLYIVLMAVSGLCSSLMQKSKEAVFLKEEDLQNLTDYLEGKIDAVYEEAYEIATGTPISDTVYGGVKRTSYKEWSITTLDSNGQPIDKTSNVKDIICLAAVMMGNSTDDYDEYKHLTDDMWTGMVPVITAKESDIYHSEDGTDTYPKESSKYYCNSSTFYANYYTDKANGVCFYEEPVSKHTTTPTVSGYITSGSGCDYYEYSEDTLLCEIEDHEHTEDCYETEWYREYYCPGHDALHCSYGYRDINIYITLLTKEDYYNGVTNEQSSKITYKIPTNFYATSFESKTATIQYRTHWDGYKKRMKSFFKVGGWENEENVEWCEELYSKFDIMPDVP